MGANPATVPSRPPRRGILRRYTIVLLAVVGGAVIVSNGVGLFLTYRGTQTRYDRLQRQHVAERQRAAAAPLARLMTAGLQEFRGELRAADAPGVPRPGPALRAADYAKATVGASTFAEIAYVDSSGRETARAAGGRIRPPHPGSFATDPIVVAGRRRGFALGDAYAVGTAGGRGLRAPFAIRDTRPGGGVILSQLDLEFVPLLVGSFPRSSDDVVYMVDGHGHLLGRTDAPDDTSLTNVSRLAEVRAAVAAGEAPRPADEEAMRGRDLAGHAVLASSTPLPLEGWYLIALRPDPGSHGPLTTAIIGLAISLVVVLGLAIVASLFLARRMTRPILAIQQGAAAMTAGRLEDRIEVRTGDELETLAEEFNAMAARLQESYATLEQRVNDRTRDLVEALDRLKRISDEKTRFLAHMSHELRTPLNAIINFADLLRDGSSGPLTERQRAYAEDMHSAGRHLLNLMTDVLDMARIEAGRIEIDTEAVSLEDLVGDGLRVVREQARAKGVRLSARVEPAAGTIEADGRKLRQVLFNLLANAIRFTEPGGTVVVRVSRQEDLVRIAVSDTGVGIDPADQERIFEEYEQAGPPDARRGGTGLGLALARRLVELHGGRILLESSPGAGSTFTVELPGHPLTSVAEDLSPSAAKAT